MSRWGMVIDLAACTGCGSCAIACKGENNVPLSEPEEVEASRTFSWLQVMKLKDEEHHSERTHYLPRPCMHCDNPLCVLVCPVEATLLDKDGIVSQIYDRCIGCRYCTNNCPYTAKYFNWKSPEWPEEIQQGLNPDVPLRPKGVVEKCTFCHHRLQRATDQASAEGRPIRQGEFQPACLEVCPSQAIHFGDLDDANSPVAKLSKTNRAFRELEDLGTEPKVYYLREDF
ncbi:MAG: 4Fe-4S dicluster domain-containing protein [Planctomycetes bacterium]|nr:4Fe-4S dicluster domain-containing protein [Planctomycetota bacterium]